MRASTAAGTRHPTGLLVAILVTIVVWQGALSAGFTADDVVSLARAARLEPTPWSFRPLSAVIAWRIEYAAFHLQPHGYHVVALVLHCLNVLALYLITIRLGGGVGAATSAATLFGASGIAFTALHAASGVGDLLALQLLLVATWIHLGARNRVDSVAPWIAAALALIAVLAKESALAWPFVIVGIEFLAGLPSPTLRNGTAVPRTHVVLPALFVGLVGVAWMAATVGRGATSATGAYAVSLSPAHLLTNLSTYLLWTVQVGTPVRDWIAAPDPAALAVGLAVVALLAALWLVHWQDPRLLRVGTLWLLGFALPVLPLLHHTYLYYLYVPWAGGALAAVGLFAWLAAPAPTQVARIAAIVLVLAFVVAEACGVRNRERATIAHLPADRTLRDAALLHNVISGLERERLPAGTVVGFVNPSPAPRVEPTPGASAPVDGRRPYYPLESVMEGGRTLRVFLPQLGYAGCSDTIPRSWTDVEVFLFEQRGYLRRWGRGPEALRREAEWVRDARTAGADSVTRTP